MKSQILNALFILLTISFTSCEDFSFEDLTSCGGGTLKVENRSLNTVQKIVINGINHGTIDPDEVKEINLSEGTYTLEFLGVSGGNGCSESVVIIANCTVESLNCRG